MKVIVVFSSMNRSKSTQKSKIAQVVQKLDGKYKCIASRSCPYMPATFSAGNFKRHLKSYHPIIFDRLELATVLTNETESPEPGKKLQKLIIYSNAQQVLLGTLQLVTTGNSPFTFFDSAALKTLLKPTYDAAGITMNRKSIPKLIDDASYLSSYFGEENIPTGRSHTVEESVLTQIKQLELREKVVMRPSAVKVDPLASSVSNDSKPFDILQYWESQKFTSPIIYRLAKVVLAAPSTQVSVERAFSALKLVLTDMRMRLSEKSIENLMLLKLNPDLHYNVANALSSEQTLVKNFPLP